MQKQEMENQILVFGKWYISFDQYQYLLSMDTGRVGKNGKIFTDPTFHATLANAIEDIYNLEIKKGLRGSGDLKTAIERMVKIYEDFEKRLEPLRQLENPEMLWNRPINKINKK